MHSSRVVVEKSASACYLYPTLHEIADLNYYYIVELHLGGWQSREKLSGFFSSHCNLNVVQFDIVRMHDIKFL